MSKVWKYELRPNGVPDTYEAALPRHAVILDVQLQASIFGLGLMLWAMVDPEERSETREFVTVMTGQEVPPNAAHISTVQDSSGLVVHIFASGHTEGEGANR